MDDLIFVSMENWDEVWRRNQFLCAGLGKRFPEIKILFVGLARDISHHLRYREFSELRKAMTWSVPGRPNITITHPPKFMPNSIAWGRRFNQAVTQAYVRRAMRRMKMKDPLLWINPHYAVHMAGCMGERAVIYDITDDWALASGSSWEKQLIIAQDDLLCRTADLVIVCSEALYRSRRARCRRILLLPNGVDAEHYKDVAERVVPDRTPKWPSPVFGYTGTLHDDRIDCDIIVALARAFPEGSVVLIGPDNLSSGIRARLTGQNNVHLPGAVPYADIASYMAGFDVCIVPHVESDFTESLNPIKLWEFLACGKPIVSSNIAGFRDFPQLCFIASGPDAFIAACKTALRVNGTGRSERMAVAAQHSWESRIDSLIAALRELGITP